MDIGLFRSIMTVVLFAAFIGIVLWAWSSRRSEDFAEAARLALNDDEDELPARAGAGQ